MRGDDRHGQILDLVIYVNVVVDVDQELNKTLAWVQ